jgi:hypothetical protein
MARTAVDTTNVYRFRVQHDSVYVSHEDYCTKRTGVYSGNVEPGTPYRDVNIVGPYTRKVPWSGWVPGYGTLKVERQQLMAYLDSPQEGAKLAWQTIEVKHYENGDRVDS